MPNVQIFHLQYPWEFPMCLLFLGGFIIGGFLMAKGLNGVTSQILNKLEADMKDLIEKDHSDKGVNH